MKFCRVLLQTEGNTDGFFSIIIFKFLWLLNIQEYNFYNYRREKEVILVHKIKLKLNNNSNNMN